MLDIHWSTILFEIINFLVITVVLYFLVFKPMTKRAEQRAIEKAEAKAALERDRIQAAERLEEIDDRLINLDDEIQGITDAAYENSQVIQRELLEATREEAERIMRNAISEARKEQTIDLKKNQARIVDTIMDITAQTLRTVTPDEVHNHLLDDLSARVWGMGKRDIRVIEQIRESLAGRNPTVELRVAKPMTTEQHMKMYNTFNALVDEDIDLQVEVRPELIAGLGVRLGDFVLDNSLLAQLEESRGEILKSVETITPPNDD